MVEYYTKAYIVFHKSGSTGEPEFNYTFSEASGKRRTAAGIKHYP